jgi:predicted short-subunit dehydrogenase-like oxidoreductase (DUF2520 family)
MSSTVGILGPGRLGRTLALLLSRAGRTVDLRGRGEGAPRGDVVLLTVPDSALAEAAATIPAGPVVLHCSGSQEVEVLRPHRSAGSLHPLMTFPGPEVAVPVLAGVPAAVAGDPEAVTRARELALDLGMRPFAVLGDRRLYHAAAVIAGNFATVLLAEASAVLIQAGVNPHEAPTLLLPLAIQSLQNAAVDPRGALTGPVARGDRAVVDAHRTALRTAGLTDLLPLYDAFVARAQALVLGRTDASTRDEG